MTKHEPEEMIEMREQDIKDHKISPRPWEEVVKCE